MIAMTSSRQSLPAEGAVFLSFNEIRVLLRSLGYLSCKGIYMPERNFTSYDVLNTMLGLSKRGILLPAEEPSSEAEDKSAGDQEISRASKGERDNAIPEDRRFRIRPDVLKMISTIGNPVDTLIYRQGETLPGYSEEYHNGREYYCYIVEGYILVTERDWTRPEMLRLRAMSPSEFSRWEEELEQEAAEEMPDIDMDYNAGEDLFQNEGPSGFGADATVMQEMIEEKSEAVDLGSDFDAGSFEEPGDFLSPIL